MRAATALAAVPPRQANFAGYSCRDGCNVPINTQAAAVDERPQARPEQPLRQRVAECGLAMRARCKRPAKQDSRQAQQTGVRASMRSYFRFRNGPLTTAMVALTLGCAGCAVHTERGFILFGDWSIGWAHVKDKSQISRAGAIRGRRCRPGCDAACNEMTTTDPTNGGMVETQPTSPEDGALAEQHAGRRGSHGPPPAVHNRFHPVPTRPVFGNPTITNRPSIESLPREYSSTPRLRSVPRPQLDPEELKEEKQKARDGDRDEQAPLIRDFSP